METYMKAKPTLKFNKKLKRIKLKYFILFFMKILQKYYKKVTKIFTIFFKNSIIVLWVILYKGEKI